MMNMIVCVTDQLVCSHFTFEKSGHQMMVVDIQGVGDLYTDPQIHTASGTDYGEGNLGTKGMALFFHTHQCNDICSSLGLSTFDLSTNEVSEMQRNVTPQCRKNTVVNFDRRLQHSLSVDSEDDTDTRMSDGDSSTVTSLDSGIDAGDSGTRRIRTMTECDDDGDHVSQSRVRISRPSCIANTTELENLGQHQDNFEILGVIHLDLARYHEACRFHEDVQDRVSSHFHLKCAADCHNLQALVAISALYTGLPNDILPGLFLDQVLDLVPDNIHDTGLHYMTLAARYGDVNSKVYLAKAYDLGTNLGSRKQDYNTAMKYYQEAVEADAEKRYLLLARQAEICLIEDSGVYDPTRAGELFTEAAEAAMEALSGKLANK